MAEKSNEFTINEIILWIWSLTLFCECIRPPFCIRKILIKLSRNLSLMLAEVLLTVGMILRLIADLNSNFPTTFLSLSCLAFTLSLFNNYLVVFKTIGWVIFSMLALMKRFAMVLLIYFIILVAFSIPIHAIIWNNTPHTFEGFFRNFVQSIFNLWWSLSHQVSPSFFDTQQCSNIANETTMGNCSQDRNAIAPILFIIFVFVTNIILMLCKFELKLKFNFRKENLLFPDLLAEAVQILANGSETLLRQWSMAFLQRVKYFDEKMLLPAPFSLFAVAAEWLLYSMAFIKKAAKMKPLVEENNLEKFNSTNLEGEGGNEEKRAVVDILLEEMNSFGNNHGNFTFVSSDNDNGNGGVSSSLGKLTVKFDEQMFSLRRRLDEIDKHQHRLSSRMNYLSNEMLSQATNTQKYPQSQNYA